MSLKRFSDIFLELVRCNSREFPESDDIEYTLYFTMYNRGAEVGNSIGNAREIAQKCESGEKREDRTCFCHCFAKMVPKRRPRRCLGCQSAAFWHPEWAPRPPQGPPKGTNVKKHPDPRRPRDARRRSQTPRGARREAPRRNFRRPETKI